MDIKEIQEQAFRRGLAEGRKSACDTNSMFKVFASCEDSSVNYVEFPDGLRLIFREGKYVGWYVCEGHEESKGISDLETPTKCEACIHRDACLAWIRHGEAMYEDFGYSVEDCPWFEDAVKGVEIDPFNKWIPVTERLPEPFTSVLAYVPSEAPLPLVHESYMVDDETWVCILEGRPWKQGVVTHWMPLPEPPKGE
ncbi:MAG: DUF551 domain-containing protein [Oscillospiraceae bacterium]|nr:DUF551 domain-containing protein [Oscillospiraceae bacterium]